MANTEVERIDRAGLQDRSSGRVGRALRVLRTKGPLEPIRLIRRHGVAESASFVIRNIRHMIADRLARKWDRDHNVDTAGSIQLDSLSIVGPNGAKGNECLCTSPKTFEFIMRCLPQDLSRHTFIDIGAGKSRTLLLASRRAFGAIIGVEFARELVEIAKRNIASFRDPAQKCRNISVIAADATTYDFPETPLVVYFYNPFSKDLFDVVMRNLAESLQANPRDCTVIYGSSSHGAIGWARPAVLATGIFKQLPTAPMPGYLDAVRTIDYAVFRFQGSAGLR